MLFFKKSFPSLLIEKLPIDELKCVNQNLLNIDGVMDEKRVID